MEKNERVLHKRHSNDQLSTGNITPRRQRSSSYQIHSKILQDESLPSVRSLQIDKSMVRHLDSTAATPGSVRPQHMLSEDTYVSRITMTPRWANYLDRTYYLRSAKQSRNSVSGDSSVIEGSGNFEDMLKSPGKQPHFQHRRRNLIPKVVGTELFMAAFTRSTPQRSAILPPQPKGDDEISVEGLEEASPVVSQPFMRRRNVKTNPSVFHDAFEDFLITSSNSVEDVSNRQEKSSDMKNAGSSPQRSRSSRSGKEHVEELEQQSDVPSQSASPNRRQIKSTDVLPSRSGQTKNAAFTRSTRQSSVVLPPQPKGGDEISVEGLEEASPIVSQPFKRRRNVKTDPSVFQSVLKDLATSSPNSEEDVSNRHEKSSDMKNASPSPQRSRSNRSGKEHVQELEQQSDVPSKSASPNRRQIKSTDVLPSGSGQTKNAAFTRSTRQRSVVLPPQPGRGDETSSLEGLEEASPIVSQPFKRRRNVKTSPSLFQDAFAGFVTSGTNSVEDVSNRHEKSSDMKNASSSPQRSRSNRSGKEHVQELEQQTDVSSKSASPNRRQIKSTDVLPSGSGQTKNAAFTRSTRQSSVVLPPQPKGGDEISVEGLEEASPIVSQPFKRRRNVKTSPSLFQDAFAGFVTSATNSVEDVSNRHEKLSDMKNASPSPQRSRSNRSGKEHVEELEKQSDVPSKSASPNRRQIKSTNVLPSGSGQTKNAAFTRLTRQSSVVLPPQPKGGDEISVEGLEEASPIVSEPFKRRRNVKTDPSVFQSVLKDLATSSPNSEEDVSNRHEKSSDMKNASPSPQRSRSNRSGKEHVQELEQQTDVSSKSASPNRRQIKSTDVLPSGSGQTKNAAFTRSTRQSSVVLPPQPIGGDEISVEGLEEASPIVSQPFKRRRNVKTNPSLIQDAFAGFVTSATNSVEDVSNRHEKSSDMKNASSSPQRSRSSRSGREHVEELDQQSDVPLEQQSNVPSNAESPDRRQTQSMDVLPSSSGQTKNAAFTRLTQQRSVILPPQPRRGDESSSLEGFEEASAIVSQQFKRRRNVKTNPSLFQDAFAGFVTSATNSVEEVSNRHENSRQTKDASATFSASQSNKETERVPTLVEWSRVPSNSASVNKRQSEKGSMGIHSGVSSGTEQNKMHSTSNKSVRPQNVAWFRRWQEKAAATGNACAFNHLSREDRTKKLEEFVRDVKKKHDAAFKSECTTKRPFIRKLEEIENVKVIQRAPKKKMGAKPIHPDLLVDGKLYRPRLKRPKSWATPRLYKLIIAKCEEKYGTLKARRKAEEFVVNLCEKVSTVIRRKKYENYEGILEEIKKSLYRLGVIKCLMEYFVFIEDYLPFEYRIKAVPCLRAYGRNTGPPMAPDTDLFADLHY